MTAAEKGAGATLRFQLVRVQQERPAPWAAAARGLLLGRAEGGDDRLAAARALHGGDLCGGVHGDQLHGLALLGLLEPPLDRGQRLPGMDQGDRAQAEPIRDKASEQVDPAFALVLAGRDEGGPPRASGSSCVTSMSSPHPGQLWLEELGSTSGMAAKCSIRRAIQP